MKKLFSSLCLSAVVSLAVQSSYAQSAIETTAEINKAMQPVFSIELYHEPGVVEDALYKNFRELVSSKGDESKGIRAYKGVVLSQVSPDKMDYYTSVSRKSKKEKDKSVVNLWVSMGNENFVSSATNPVIADMAKAFLNNFMNTTATYQHGLDVKAQEEAVAKAQKKVNSDKYDIVDYEKRIADLQRKLEDAKKDLSKKEAELAAEQQKLESIKAKN